MGRISVDKEISWGVSVLKALGRCQARCTRFSSQEIFLALYLMHTSESTWSTAVVKEAMHTLAAMHRVAGLPLEGESPLVQKTDQGLRQLLAKPKMCNESLLWLRC